MYGMDSFQKNLHMTRQEALMVFLLVVLLAGLMFSVGLWVGMGFPGANGSVAHNNQLVESGRDPSSKEGEENKLQEEIVPGAELKKAYRESKELALAEAMLNFQSIDTPKSVLDGAAHKQAHQEWDRKPSSTQAEKAEMDAMETLREKENKRLKDGPPAKVKSLFERSPDATDDFSPVPGTYTIQVASFATLDEALAMVKQLRQRGYLDAYNQKIKINDGEIWHRVSVGSYPNPVYARTIGEQIRKRGLSKDFVVRKVAD